jgi:hypothetical protein
MPHRHAGNGTYADWPLAQRRSAYVARRRSREETLVVHRRVQPRTLTALLAHNWLSQSSNRLQNRARSPT